MVAVAIQFTPALAAGAEPLKEAAREQCEPRRESRLERESRSRWRNQKRETRASDQDRPAPRGVHMVAAVRTVCTHFFPQILLWRINTH
jgi:hypothetical protein